MLSFDNAHYFKIFCIRYHLNISYSKYYTIENNKQKCITISLCVAGPPFNI